MRLSHLLISISIVTACVGCAVPTAYNPAKCITRANNPHPSHHRTGTINAEVRQTCPVVLNQIGVEAKLWERRWWGYNIIDQDTAGPIRGRQISVFVNAPCRTNSIRVTGHGHYEWNGKHIKSAETSKTKHVSC